MNRILALSVYLYMCLAAAHWASVAHLLHGPTGRLWCGNAITDPLLFLINKLTPVIAGCVGELHWTRFRERRRRLVNGV